MVLRVWFDLSAICNNVTTVLICALTYFLLVGGKDFLNCIFAFITDVSYVVEVYFGEGVV